MYDNLNMCAVPGSCRLLQSISLLVRYTMPDCSAHPCFPQLVEFILRKVMEEFERRLHAQGEQVKKVSGPQFTTAQIFRSCKRPSSSMPARIITPTHTGKYLVSLADKECTERDSCP